MNCKLGDIADVIMGQSPESSYYNTIGEGTPFLQGNRTFGFKYPSFDTYTTKTTKMCKAGDTVMSVRAPVGDLNVAPIDFCLGRGVCSIRAKEPNNQNYIYYLLKNCVKLLVNAQNGTVFGSVNRKDICELKVPSFSVDSQLKIASILSSIDDKIELNNKINDNLQQQVKTLYEDMVLNIDFNSLPLGYKIINLSEIAEIFSGKRPNVRATFPDAINKYPLVGAASIMGYTDNYNFNSRILVTGRVGTHGVIQRFSSPCWASDNTLIITSNYYEFVSQVLQHFDYRSMNRGSTQPLITQSDLKKKQLILPNIDKLESFEKNAESLMDKYDYNVLQNKRLSELRDTLLPKLMSGEIDVSNIKLDL